VIHCLNGNLLRALLGFGWLDDERVQAAIAWQVAAVTGDGMVRWYASGTSGPEFRCAANGGRPCAWGATKVALALARIPPARRTLGVANAIEVAVDLLLSCNPASAEYPVAPWSARPSRSWFKLGFPSGYVADVLQVLEAFADLGRAHDPRIAPAIEWLRSRQYDDGRWRNEYAYNGKTWADIERQGSPSKWVTLRACRVLKAASA
jgi:hypothetical protein